ncbi:hypothetical protein HCH04_14865 [Bacteroides thetaiotaomicron]|uniref:hypothetical protein n=1 Tax=Bacteroides thetaiotaomicron TaxID=818 RepID=UPI001C8BFB6D|nr:hypothetical protein [Bacteroides thetaiotaomicron]MBX9049592.1 hypothetical protein [Bacteroides thetaiotaomicron]MBX9074242.1 hypothetical protein [Bacteroides thetaiotaomicron]
MKYLLIEESAYNRLKSLAESKVPTPPVYTEADYWATTKEACVILNVGLATLNAFRQAKLLSCISIKGNNHYKRVEVINIKTQMDKEMLSMGYYIEVSKVVKPSIIERLVLGAKSLNP